MKTVKKAKGNFHKFCLPSFTLWPLWGESTSQDGCYYLEERSWKYGEAKLLKVFIENDLILWYLKVEIAGKDSQLEVEYVEDNYSLNISFMSFFFLKTAESIYNIENGNMKLMLRRTRSSRWHLRQILRACPRKENPRSISAGSTCLVITAPSLMPYCLLLLNLRHIAIIL